MSLRLPVMAVLGALAVAASPATAAQTNFSTLIGQATPLTAPLGNNTVSFDSSAGPATFQVADTTGLFTFSAGLGDFNSFSGDPLTISFATPVTATTIRYGLEDLGGLFGSDTLTVTANTGQTATFFTNLNGQTLAEPEGAQTFAGSPFSSLTITSANPFAIASVDVPEPVSASLLGGALLALALGQRRKR